MKQQLTYKTDLRDWPTKIAIKYLFETSVEATNLLPTIATNQSFRIRQQKQLIDLYIFYIIAYKLNLHCYAQHFNVQPINELKLQQISNGRLRLSISIRQLVMSILVVLLVLSNMSVVWHWNLLGRNMDAKVVRNWELIMQSKMKLALQLIKASKSSRSPTLGYIFAYISAGKMPLSVATIACGISRTGCWRLLLPKMRCFFAWASLRNLTNDKMETNKITHGTNLNGNPLIQNVVFNRKQSPAMANCEGMSVYLIDVFSECSLHGTVSWTTVKVNACGIDSMATEMAK
ncbi:hypothetical protein T12_1309 [Trichinella patagoniensis]|uniref:Uncharacterized protein n=1 Tax=Trichinella patagoniensis TaxID=990121 RepID=A0A0V1A1S6_9BILA|nr:hypothetical protein T12_1309 [Trichinella patagoniensis]